MIRGKKVGVIIPAAGKGTRMGSDLRKQFLQLAGEPVILHTLRCFQSLAEIDVVIVAASDDAVSTIMDMKQIFGLSKLQEVVQGGAQRQDSVWNGLQAMKHHAVQLVVVHDAVRPFVSQNLIYRVLTSACDNQASIPAVRPKETVKMAMNQNGSLSTLQRENLWLAQTPQVFNSDLLYRAFLKANADHYYGTDDASLVEYLGESIHIVEGSYDNIKITTPEDLELGEIIIKRLKRK